MRRVKRHGERGWFLAAFSAVCFLLSPAVVSAQTATAITTIAGSIVEVHLGPIDIGCPPPPPLALPESQCQDIKDGVGLTEARFRGTLGMAVDGNGNILVADVLPAVPGGVPFPPIIRIVSPVVTTTTSIAAPGTLLYMVGPSPDPLLAVLGGTPSVPLGLGTDGVTDIAVTATLTPQTGAAGNWVVTPRGNQQVRVFTPAGAFVNSIGSGALVAPPDLIVADGAPGVATFNRPASVALDSAGNMYVADQNNNAIRRIDAVTGVVSTVAGRLSPRAVSPACAAACTAVGGFGDGLANAAGTAFHCPTGITRGASDAEFFIADSCNHRIRRLDLLAGTVSTVAGSIPKGFADGTGTGARFNLPTNLDREPAGNLFVTDAANDKLRMVTPGGVVTTVGRNETLVVDLFDVLNSRLLGTIPPPPTPDHFLAPWGVAVGTLGADGLPALKDNIVFVGDLGNFRVREVVRLP